MPFSLPYLASNKNVGALFEKIAAAKIPDKFTHAVLTQTIGLKGANDRQLIPLLRNLGFIDQANTPTPDYNLLKGENRAIALADGMKRAYGPLFDANQQAHKLPLNSLKSLISQVAGADADASGRIAATFSALTKVADFDGELAEEGARKGGSSGGGAGDTGNGNNAGATGSIGDTPPPPPRAPGLRTEFHYNIQIHLPANGNEETYLNIFNAIRKTFQ